MGAVLEQDLQSSGVSPWVVTDDVIQVLSDTVTPQGVVAVVADPSVGVEALAASDLTLVLADVRDPGNAGTLVRSAAAARAGAVVFAHGSVDPLHPKVVRSAAGALFGVPLVRAAPLEKVATALREASAAIIGAAADADDDLFDVDLSGRCAIVLGNEAWGMSPDVEALVDRMVRIPMPGPVESLNVSTAGSILLFEVLRQRRAVGDQ